MDITTFRMLHDNVLIKSIEVREKDGILKPQSYEDKPEVGEVISIGAGRILENGGVTDMMVAVGETVLFNKYSATKFNLDGKDYYVVRQEDVVGAK